MHLITVNAEPPKPPTFEDLGYVQVVRCKDCKYCFAEGFVHEHNICDKHEWIQGQPDDWYCADGERRVKLDE